MNNELLTVDPIYFKLQGLEKRVYEIFRKHLGEKQTAWHIGLEKLQNKCGSQSPARRFRFEVRRILDRAEKNRLEEVPVVGYQNADIGRAARARDAMKVLRSSMPVSKPSATAVAEASA